LIHGHHDPAVAVEYVKTFAETEGYTLFEMPEHGQLIFYSEPDIVLGRIRAFADELANN
jgi:hypothetical protein